VADPHELIRAYLAQRRELGEREFVLDELDLDEALRVIGLKGGGSLAAARPEAGAERPMPAPRSAPVPPSPSPRTPTAGAEVAAGEDWRAAFRAAGIAPTGERAAGPPVPPPVAAVSTTAPDAPSTPADPVKRSDIELTEGLRVDVTTRAPFSPALEAATTLDAVAALTRGCTACALAAEAKQAVPGEGDPNAELVIVGEGPGATEDETGRPFVGKAGDLLTKILGAIDLPREAVYICNVVKHRPPGNRNPAPEEIQACRPYLERQLTLVRPKVILALGTFAAQTLLDTKLPIGKLRGFEHTYHGVPLVVTYHPAALLRNPAWKRPTWEDVQFARRLLDRARGTP
jgi:uracil-DNA glycosylase family 4